MFQGNEKDRLDSQGGGTYNKGRKVGSFAWWAYPIKREPPCSGCYMAVLLFPVLCDQYNHEGQNSKNDHDHLIIRHTLTPFFGSQG